MKLKFTFCLAVVLCSALTGCSIATVHHGDAQPVKASSPPEVRLKLVYVDSEETNAQNGFGRNVVDGDPNTYWHTQWHDKSPGLPHEIVIELIPPSVIKGFTYLPRQDASENGTIKDFEFYVSNNGRHFGDPIKKGTFGPGKDEKIETFEPVNCRFIKLKAISEINGMPWTSAAEIRVIPATEQTSGKDYYRGIKIDGPARVPGSVRNDAAKPDAINSFVAALSANGGLWLNGIDGPPLSQLQATSPEEVVSQTFQKAKFEAGLLTSYRIVEVRKVRIPPPFPSTYMPATLPSYTAVLVDTNLGRMIVLIRYTDAKGSTPGHWWRRIYDASPPIKRLF